MGGPSRKHIDVLMYHSIAEGDDPTYMRPELFAAQMAALAEAGYRVAPLSELATPAAAAHSTGDRTAVITFDDAYTDFARHAAPILLDRGWEATVFAPTAWVGRKSGWAGACGQQLLDWQEIRDLFKAGIAFGSHAMSHRNLTRLTVEEMKSELTQSRARLEEELGAPVRSFAAPYGATNDLVRAEIARAYEIAVGTRFDRARPDGDSHDIPRIEMYYFKDIDLWRRYLAGRAEGYLAIRQAARSVRAMFS